MHDLYELFPDALDALQLVFEGVDFGGMKVEGRPPYDEPNRFAPAVSP